MNALGHFLTRRRGAPKHGSGEQLSDEQLLAAIEKLPPDHPVHMPLPAPVVPPEIRAMERAMYPRSFAEAAYPQGPTFTPSARSLANAREFPAAASPAARGTHARTTPRHVQQDGSTLLRVRDRLRDLPAPPLTRAEQFTADMRAARKGGLPVFRAVAHQIGWCGLNEEYLPLATPSARSMAAWDKQAADAADAMLDAAQAELRGTVAEQDRYEARVRDAADAAIALGYPGSAL